MSIEDEPMFKACSPFWQGILLRAGAWGYCALVPLAAVRTERGQRMQELDTQINELKEQRHKVYIDWADANQCVTNKEHHIKRIDREIRELRGEEAK